MSQKTILIKLFMVILSILIFGNTFAQSATFYVPDDYTTIYESVDGADPCDQIIVRDGTYTENVDVNKDHLIIRSESTAEATIVQGQLVYYEDFSSDPGWLTDQPANFYWDPTLVPCHA